MFALKGIMNKIIALLKKYQKTLVLGAALGIIILYITPIDQILAQTGGGGNSKNQGQKQDKANKDEKDNNCENGLPPHKNGNDDNGNHLGCYKIVNKEK